MTFPLVATPPDAAAKRARRAAAAPAVRNVDDDIRDDFILEIPRSSRSFEGLPAQILSRNEIISLYKKGAQDLSSTMVNGERVREEAVRQRDLIRLSCIQERLNQMKLFKKLADDSLAALGREDVRQDELRLRHEFRSVEMGTTKLRQLYQEMLECAGADTTINETITELAGTPRVGVGAPDPTSVTVTTPPPDRPVAASPYF